MMILFRSAFLIWRRLHAGFLTLAVSDIDRTPWLQQDLELHEFQLSMRFRCLLCPFRDLNIFCRSGSVPL